MNASVIRCPGCGAADTSTATAAGVHTCVYCGVRYQFSGGTPHTMAPAGAAPSTGRGLRFAAIGAGVLVLAIGAVLTLAGSAPSRPIDAVRAGGPSTVEAVRSVSAAPINSVSAAPAKNLAVSVTPSVEQTAPATAEFTLESAQPSGTNALWIYGYFHNTSPFTLGKTKVTAVFYDKDDKEIGQGSGYTEDDVIAADARVPTVVLVSDAPAVYARIGFEVSPQRPTYLPAEVEGLQIEAEAPSRDNFLGWKYVGKVHNKSGQAARFVKVDVLAFDQNDKFAGHAYTYASADALADGATARFNGMLLGARADFKRFEFRVSGQPVR